MEKYTHKLYPNFAFEITSKDGDARCGTLSTPHGDVQTPAFIFCATKAAIKGLDPQKMRELGTQIILSNTYHLMLQPGSKLVDEMGGLQKFTGWNGPMLTDSGGYQIFSLGHGSVAEEIKGKRLQPDRKTLLKITEEGAKFKSYIDGKIHFLTPELSMEIQKELGADLIVTLDECTPFNVDKSYTAKSLKMTHRWEKRCLDEFHKLNKQGKQALYAVVQGGVYEDLRSEAAEFINEHDFWAHAIGGSLGAEKSQMYDIVALTCSKLDMKRPVHLLGIGGVKDIFEGVKCGIDTFDCVHPTRFGRHGGAFVKPSVKGAKKGQLNLNNAIHRNDKDPIDEKCACPTCQNYSRSYIHHLLKASEMLAFPLLISHNVYFMNKLMEDIRKAIEAGGGALAKLEKEYI